VIHNQLASAAEKIGQRLLALRPIERVRFLYFLPRHLPPLPAQFVAQPRKFLSLSSTAPSRLKPFRLRHDSRTLHLAFFEFGLHLHLLSLKFGSIFLWN